MNMLYISDDTVITAQSDIEAEVLNYYAGIMGTNDNNVQHINIPAMRNGPKLSMEQIHSIVIHVSEEEIITTLNGIGDLKSLGIDGFGANIFKVS